MTQQDTERWLATTVREINGLKEALAIRANHWSLSNVIHPGKRHELELGKRVELVLRIESCTRSWGLLRRPAKSATTLEGTCFVPDVPGVYVVRCEIGGWVRDAEFVCASDAMLDCICKRGSINNRCLIFRGRINDPTLSTAELAAALESNPPQLGALFASVT